MTKKFIKTRDFPKERGGSQPEKPPSYRRGVANTTL